MLCRTKDARLTPSVLHHVVTLAEESARRVEAILEWGAEARPHAPAASRLPLGGVYATRLDDFDAVLVLRAEALPQVRTARAPGVVW